MAREKTEGKVENFIAFPPQTLLLGGTAKTVDNLASGN